MAGANNTGFGGAINSAASSTDVAGSLQSVMTTLQSMIAPCQANVTTATNIISQAQTIANTINQSAVTSLFNQMQSNLATMQTALQSNICDTTTSTAYLTAIQNGYTQLQAAYATYQTNMQNATGVYTSGTLTAVKLSGCCNWWTQGASQGNWNVSSISGGNATLNLNQLNGSVTVPLSTLQTLMTTGQTNIQLTMRQIP